MSSPVLISGDMGGHIHRYWYVTGWYRSIIGTLIHLSCPSTDNSIRLVSCPSLHLSVCKLDQSSSKDFLFFYFFLRAGAFLKHFYEKSFPMWCDVGFCMMAFLHLLGFQGRNCFLLTAEWQFLFEQSTKEHKWCRPFKNCLIEMLKCWEWVCPQSELWRQTVICILSTVAPPHSGFNKSPQLLMLCPVRE